MHLTYQIKPSYDQALLLAAVYLSAAIAWWLVLEPGLFLVGIELLVLLLGVRDIRRLLDAQRSRLRLLGSGRGIELAVGEQTHFFPKYKVYPSRWFAILKLVNESKTMTLILNPDCFNTVTDYRNLRYELSASEAPHAA